MKIEIVEYNGAFFLRKKVFFGLYRYYSHWCYWWSFPSIFKPEIMYYGLDSLERAHLCIKNYEHSILENKINREKEKEKNRKRRKAQIRMVEEVIIDE